MFTENFRVLSFHYTTTLQCISIVVLQQFTILFACQYCKANWVYILSPTLCATVFEMTKYLAWFYELLTVIDYICMDPESMIV